MHSLLLFISAVFSLLLFDFGRTAPDTSQFQVHSLPDGPSIPSSWAGRLAVPNTEKGNAIFFWLFQTEDPEYDDNFIIWFNGGPGCSSLIGLTTGNGPISFEGNSTRLVANPYSWTKFGHVLYVDQPVGTGYSTASQPYPSSSNDRLTSDFYAWLQSFLTYFPHLQSKKVHLMGESYAGIYIPYFASEIVNNQDSFPINLRSMTLGDGSFGNPAAMSAASVGKFMESQQSLLQIPDDILAVFTEADQKCSFDKVLEQADNFPPQGTIYVPGNPEYLNYKRRRQQRLRRDLGDITNATCNIMPTTPQEVRSSIMNSTCYGPCATFSTAMDYLGTVSASGAGKPCYDVYDISHDCSTIDSLPLVASYFSRADVQVALNLLPSSSSSSSSSSAAADHTNITTGPTSITPTTFAPCNSTILTTVLAAQSPRAPVYSLLPTLVTSHNISLHVYFGEYDMLLNHFGAELTLQNMTWHGAQGFSQPINRVFFPDNASPRYPGPCGNTNQRSLAPHHKPRDNNHVDDCVLASPSTPSSSSSSSSSSSPTDTAGKWASERGVTYHLFWGAGHSVFASKPGEMFAYVRDVVVAA